jgi:hypothetical protein
LVQEIEKRFFVQYDQPQQEKEIAAEKINVEEDRAPRAVRAAIL